MRVKVAMRIQSAIILMAAFGLGARGQLPSVEGNNPSSGTLNLILANENGFVMAADSRRSGSMPFKCSDRKAARKGPGTSIYYCDDSQKLFPTGQESAMVVAGFAVAQKGKPLGLEVASVLRKRFGPGGHTYLAQDLGSGKISVRNDTDPGPPGGFEGVLFDSQWCRLRLAQDLTAIASLYDPSSLPPDKMVFQAAFAGIQKDGTVALKWQTFAGSWVTVGPLNALVPRYDVQETPAPIDPVQNFVWSASGVTPVAVAILQGYYKSSDPVILKYYSRLHSMRGRDSMSLEEMTRLVRAILRETKKFTYFVGGPDEIAVFPSKGQPRLQMPTLPTEKSIATRFLPKEGLLYTKEHPGGQSFASNLMSVYFEDFQHPLDEVIAQFFLGCEFKDIPVVLDNNYFVRNAFEGVTFKYRGAAFFSQGGAYRNCVVEVPEGITLPSSEIFDRCRIVKEKEISWEKNTVGAPLQYELSGTQITLPIR
jgi:hypothetical protein